MRGLDPRIHHVKTLLETDGFAGRTGVYARLPTGYARQ
jgi:hypothetical protein